MVYIFFFFASCRFEFDIIMLKHCYDVMYLGLHLLNNHAGTHYHISEYETKNKGSNQAW